MDINKVIMESIKDITTVTEISPAEVKIPKAGEKAPGYIGNLRQAFKEVGEETGLKGPRKLHVSGKGNIPPVNLKHQKTLDAKYREIAARGPVGKAAQKVKEAAGAAKEAGKEAGQKTAELASKYFTLDPSKMSAGKTAALAAALAAGAGAVAFRKKLAQAYKDVKKKISNE